ASKTSKNRPHGRPGVMLLVVPISIPASAHATAQVRPVPMAPRIRLSQFVIAISHRTRSVSAPRVHFALQSSTRSHGSARVPQSRGPCVPAPGIGRHIRIHALEPEVTHEKGAPEAGQYR